LLGSTAVRGSLCWLPFALLVLVFFLSFLGLSYSIYPSWRSTGLRSGRPPVALSRSILIGVCVTLPVIIAYTGFSYRVFRGKTRVGLCLSGRLSHIHRFRAGRPACLYSGDGRGPYRAVAIRLSDDRLVRRRHPLCPRRERAHRRCDQSRVEEQAKLLGFDQSMRGPGGPGWRALMKSPAAGGTTGLPGSSRGRKSNCRRARNSAATSIIRSKLRPVDM